MKWIVLFAVGLTMIISSSMMAQNIIFQLIQAGAQSNGIGSASVAFPTDDPLVSVYNPAHLGMQSFTSKISGGYSSARWLPQVSDKFGINIASYNAGLNLRDINSNYLPLSIGAGYSRIRIDLGSSTVTSPGPLGPYTIGTYETFVESNQFTVSAAVDYIVRFSAGVTYKKVLSKEAFEARTNLYDLGFLLDVPVVSIYEKISNAKAGDNIRPVFNLGCGASVNNLGKDYFEYKLPNPVGVQVLYEQIPKYARAGVSFSAGFNWTNKSVTVAPLMFKWTVESNNPLYDSIFIPDGTNKDFTYGKGLGKIKIFDELILGHSNVQTEKLKGWELTVFEFLSVSGGRFQEDVNYGDRNYNTMGYTLRSGGLVKMLRVLEINSLLENTSASYVLNRLSVDFSYSRLVAVNHILSGTEFYGVNVFWKMF